MRCWRVGKGLRITNWMNVRGMNGFATIVIWRCLCTYHVYCTCFVWARKVATWSLLWAPCLSGLTAQPLAALSNKALSITASQHHLICIITGKESCLRFPLTWRSHCCKHAVQTRRRRGFGWRPPHKHTQPHIMRVFTALSAASLPSPAQGVRKYGFRSRLGYEQAQQLSKFLRLCVVTVSVSLTLSLCLSVCLTVCLWSCLRLRAGQCFFARSTAPVAASSTFCSPPSTTCS